MKKLFGTAMITLIIVTFILLPYVLLSEYIKEIREFNIQLSQMRYKIESMEKENRILQQDVDIINNIILSKDFLKSID